MKNLHFSLLSFILGALFLTACETGAGTPGPGTTNPPAASFTFSSSYEHDSDIILCRNELNTITYSFTALNGPGSIESWTETYTNTETGEEIQTTLYPGNATITGNSFTVTSTTTSGALPAGLQPNGISIIPTDPTDSEITLSINVIGTNGERSTASHTFPMFNCEPEPIATDFQFSSSYELNGEPAICDDHPTTINYTFHTPSPTSIEDWTETYTGVITGQSQTFTHLLTDATITGNVVRAMPRTFGSGAAPLNLEPNAIVIVPDEPVPALIGETILTIDVTSTDGHPIGIGSITLPVVGGCNAN